ncbi:MAG: DUF2232 domain-containing protein [Spirochaetales bacterium]|nr:DUF2232 domain-containing protein [Spirochaetales bacterium]
MENGRRIHKLLIPLGFGVLSAVLFASVRFAPVFLLPLSALGAAKGFKAGCTAAGTSALTLCAVFAGLLAMGGVTDPVTYLVACVPPLVLIAGQTAMLWPALGKLPMATRGLLVAGVAALATWPVLASAIASPELRAWFGQAAGEASGIIGTELDADALWASLSRMITLGHGSGIFLWLFASMYMGSSFGMRWRMAKAGKAASERLIAMGALDDAEEANKAVVEELAKRSLGNDESAVPPPLHSYRVPRYLVWPFLASWAGILVSRYVSLPAFQAVVWNVAVSLSICYGVQGLAVAGALFGRIGLAPAARVLGPIAVAIALMAGVPGLVAVGVFAALGTLETWIPFRTVVQGDKP